MKKALVIAAVAALCVPAFARGFDLTSVQAMSSVSSGIRGGDLATGFEAAEGFAPGYAGQNGWSGFNSTAAPVISTANPATGSQHLRLEYDADVAAGVAVGVESPLLGPAYVAGETAVISFDINISATDGADYTFESVDSVAGIINTRVTFSWTDNDGDGVAGDIRVFEDDGLGGFQVVDTGAEYTPGVYQNVMIELTLGGAIDYYLDGSLIYSDANGIPGTATTMDAIAFYDDNFNYFNSPPDTGDVDNVSVTPEPASLMLLALAGLALRRR
jgi:MYXO-CTERM domain-containing protein